MLCIWDVYIHPAKGCGGSESYPGHEADQGAISCKQSTCLDELGCGKKEETHMDMQRTCKTPAQPVTWAQDHAEESKRPPRDMSHPCISTAFTLNDPICSQSWALAEVQVDVDFFFPSVSAPLLFCYWAGKRPIIIACALLKLSINNSARYIDPMAPKPRAIALRRSKW